MLSLFLRGLLLGFSIAAPVGPIGVLCIRRTLAQGRKHGLVSGLGAASADAIYGTIAAFGLTAISSALVSQQRWLGLFGGLFLLYLGIRTLLTQPAERSDDERSDSGTTGNLWQSYGSVFALTITNPMTILSFAAVFAGLGLAQSAASSHWQSAMIVLGVFCGSALWWLGLSTLVSLVRQRFTARHMLWINRISGVIIIAFAAVALISAFR